MIDQRELQKEKERKKGGIGGIGGSIDAVLPLPLMVVIDMPRQRQMDHALTTVSLGYRRSSGTSLM